MMMLHVLVGKVDIPVVAMTHSESNREFPIIAQDEQKNYTIFGMNNF